MPNTSSDLLRRSVVDSCGHGNPFENRTLKTSDFTGLTGSRTARKYSNATNRERLRRTAADN